MKQRILYGLMGLGLGFGLGSKEASKSDSSIAVDEPNSGVPIHNESQLDALNEALEKVSEYEEIIASLNRDLESNQVDSTPVNGFHFNPDLVFDRSVSDRNISIVGDAISVNGVNHFNLPVYVISEGNSQEVRTKFKPELNEINLNLTESDLSHQIKIGNKIYQMTTHDNSSLPSEAMVLLEFDKSVNLKEVINNIVIKTANSGNNSQWNNYISGFIALYRTNILAFKLYNIMDTTLHNLANLALKANIGNQELPLISVAVVDSMSASVVPNNSISSSYKLAGNSIPLV